MDKETCVTPGAELLHYVCDTVYGKREGLIKRIFTISVHWVPIQHTHTDGRGNPNPNPADLTHLCLWGRQ